MPTEAPIISWLDHLWQLYPATGVLVVGAGSGYSPWIEALKRWNAQNVTLVEADDRQFQHLQLSLAMRKGWHLHKQVIAPETGSVTFFHASNPSESGLLEPEELRPLWPNLKTRQKSIRQAISLGELLTLNETELNWLLLDCLPAGALLGAAGDAVAGFDVIVTRERIAEDGSESSGKRFDENSVASLLSAHGFQMIAEQQTRHPLLVHSLYVRVPTIRTGQLTTALAEAEARFKKQEIEIKKSKHIAEELQAKLEKICKDTIEEQKSASKKTLYLNESQSVAVKILIKVREKLYVIEEKLMRQTQRHKERPASELSAAFVTSPSDPESATLDSLSLESCENTPLLTCLDQVLALSCNIDCLTDVFEDKISKQGNKLAEIENCNKNLEKINESQQKDLAVLNQQKKKTELKTAELELKNGQLAMEFQRLTAEVILLKEILLKITDPQISN